MTWLNEFIILAKVNIALVYHVIASNNLSSIYSYRHVSNSFPILLLFVSFVMMEQKKMLPFAAQILEAVLASLAMEIETNIRCMINSSVCVCVCASYIYIYIYVCVCVCVK